MFLNSSSDRLVAKVEIDVFNDSLLSQSVSPDYFHPRHKIFFPADGELQLKPKISNLVLCCLTDPLSTNVNNHRLNDARIHYSSGGSKETTKAAPPNVSFGGPQYHSAPP